MKPAIRVDNLSKMYRIGEKPNQIINLSERFTQAFRLIKNRMKSARQINRDFWALSELNFEVTKGEVVGIIGRNGAGKSTLLKILSRIVEPTKGHAEIRGRLGSLLEVGTGFHPELTGRENIYLNGSILGMKRWEIQDRFNAIVDFSGISQFLDTPVKRYSSGMYVRLAFAVAAHLNPEILVIDEVLAVGDSTFQKQCLGKMRDVSRTGRTVLFVSHNMSAIESLCSHCIFLEAGKIKSIGSPAKVIKEYLEDNKMNNNDAVDLADHRNRQPGSKKYMKFVSLSSENTNAVGFVQMGRPLSINVHFDCAEESIRPVIGVVIKDKYDVAIFGINNRIIPGFEYAQQSRQGIISCVFDSLPLMPGSYGIDLYLGEEHTDHDIVFDAIRFSVESADVFGSGKIPPPITGNIFVPARFSLKQQ